MGKKVAVIGGGMFGVCSALELARGGADVTLFEAEHNILLRASGSNQWRLHSGYHYPLSDETAEACRRSLPLFRNRYSEAIVTNQDHYYAIASESRVPTNEYKEFCDRHDLWYDEIETDLISTETVDTVLEVDEDHVDVDILREQMWDELQAFGVNVVLGRSIDSIESLSGFDSVVEATYGKNKQLLENYPSLQREYQFEICEVPVIRLPDRYKRKNIIVVYGPFMSTDHLGRKGLFAMGDYEIMVHAENIGERPKIPTEYEDLLGAGIVNAPDQSNFDQFKKHGKKYIPGVADCEYVGSLFSVRSKLPGVEETAKRPTLVQREGDVVSVFGGKLVTALGAAEEVRAEIL